MTDELRRKAQALVDVMPDNLANMQLADLRAALRSTPVPASNVSEAWDTLREAVRQAGVLRTESVTITAPFARSLLTLLDGLGPKMELEPASNVSEGLHRVNAFIDGWERMRPSDPHIYTIVTLRGTFDLTTTDLRAALAHAAPDASNVSEGLLRELDEAASPGGGIVEVRAGLLEDAADALRAALAHAAPERLRDDAIAAAWEALQHSNVPFPHRSTIRAALAHAAPDASNVSEGLRAFDRALGDEGFGPTDRAAIMRMARAALARPDATEEAGRPTCAPDPAHPDDEWCEVHMAHWTVGEAMCVGARHGAPPVTDVEPRIDHEDLRWPDATEEAGR